jgi:hypothetical protein
MNTVLSVTRRLLSKILNLSLRVQMREDYRLWRMKRYLQNLTRAMKRTQREYFFILTVGTSPMKQSQQPLLDALGAIAARSDEVGFVAVRERDSSVLQLILIRMHFGFTSNTAVTESSRKQVACISVEAWSTGPFLGHRGGQWFAQHFREPCVELEIVLVVCARGAERHRWGMRVSDGNGTETTLDNTAHGNSVCFEGGEPVDVKGVGGSHHPLSGQMERSDDAGPDAMLRASAATLRLQSTRYATSPDSPNNVGSVAL